MNKEWLLFHLRETQEELTRTLRELETDPDYDEIEFGVAMEHMYNHLNTAWNSRNVDPPRAWASAEDDFYAWRSFPSDIDME